MFIVLKKSRLGWFFVVFFALFFLQSDELWADPVENAFMKKVTISGYVRDASSGEDLIGATVFVEELKVGTSSNEYGFFSMNLAPGNYTLVCSYIGYITRRIDVDLSADKTVYAELSSVSEELEEIIISTDKPEEVIARPQMSVAKLPGSEIKNVPVLMGEVDLIKVIQLLPGVHSTSEGSSGFSVRGGSADQNLILLDEATVYNASHLLGFLSVFNNDVIKDIRLYKGDLPASMGGRLSSALDIRMKEGNNKRFSGSGGIGTISARLTMESPIVEDQSSFIISGRRTYLDFFLPLSGNEDIRDNKLYFYDFNMKVNHRVNDNNRLFLSGYFGRDVFENNFANMAFGNKTLTARWNHLFNTKLFSNLTFIYSKYDYELGTPDQQANAFVWKSNLDDFSLKADFSWFPSTAFSMRFGGQSSYHIFEPGWAKGVGDQSIFTRYEVQNSYNLEHALYGTVEQKLNDWLVMKYGVRLSAFQCMGETVVYDFDENYALVDSAKYGKGDVYKTYFGVEPRVGINIMLNSVTSVKASYARTRQNVQLAQNSTAGTPLDVWFPASPNVKPQIADQYAIGVFRNFRDNTIEASIEGYYKDMRNAIDFKDHADLLLNKQMEGELRFGKAYAYGVECLLRFNGKKLNGWVGYTWSRAFRKFKDINDGVKYSAPYDKPHDISIVMNYQMSKRMLFSANWVYSTGTPVTFPTGRYEIGNKIVPVYSNRNAYRMPDYHRLDLSLTLRPRNYGNKAWKGEWNFSLYNAYGRKNAWAINFVQDSENPNITYAEKTYLFSFIPSITYNFKF